MEEPGAHGDIAENVNAVIARIAKGGLTAEQQSFALLKQGRLYAEQESYDSAIEVFNKAISLHVSVHNFIARAACYEKILSWEDAYFDYCFALRLDPESGLLLAHRGLCLAKLNKFDIALEDLTKACQTEPSNANFYNRASVSVDAKRYQAALRDVIHILKNEDQPPPPALRSRCMYLKAVIGLELGYYDTVIEDMRELLLANPNIGPTRALLAKAFRLKGDPATAETQISFAIAVDPSSPDHYIERSNARASIGTSQSISDAVTDLDAAVRMLMRPIGVKSQAVSRLSRQSSDLMPVLQTMSSREFEVVKPPLSRQLGSTGKMEQRRVLLVTAPSTAPESPSRNKPAASCPPSALRDAMSTNLSPKSILRSRATSMDSLDSNSDCNSHADIDRSRRPRLVRTASVSKKDAIAEIVGERSLAKRMKVVAHVLCQRAETRLLLLSEGMPLNVRRMHMQRSLHDAIKVACCLFMILESFLMLLLFVLCRPLNLLRAQMI